MTKLIFQDLTPVLFPPAAYYFCIVFPITRFSSLTGWGRIMLSSRSGLALLGVINPAGISLLTFILIVWAKRIPRLYFKRETGVRS